MTGNKTYLAAVKGAWRMFKDSFIHVGGSMALNEGSIGTNLSQGLWCVERGRTVHGAQRSVNGG